MEFTNEPIVFRANENFFVNTKALIIYYYDVLNIPWLTYLAMIRGSDELSKLLNLGLLSKMNTEEIIYWYVMNRKNFNPLKDLWLGDPSLSDELDSFLFYELARPENLFLHEVDYPFLSMPDSVKQIIENQFCEHVYVYTEVENPNIEKVVHAKYGKEVRILYGDLYDHLSVLPADATYIFSRFELLDTLIDTNRLNYSTVLLPYDFRYNLNEDKTAFVKDLEKIQKEYTFKFGLYNTIRSDK